MTTNQTSSTQESTVGAASPFGNMANQWIAAGGNPQAADMAAAVALASSGGNNNASITQSDGSTAVGAWLINSTFGALSTTDPSANARAAIQISNNGTDWSSWCVAWSDNDCGNSGGTYLGDGSNALAALQQKLTPASYNVAGAQVAGNGTSPSQVVAKAGATSPTSTASKVSGLTGNKNVKYVIGFAVLVALVLLFHKEHKRGK